MLHALSVLVTAFASSSSRARAGGGMLEPAVGEPQPMSPPQLPESEVKAFLAKVGSSRENLQKATHLDWHGKDIDDHDCKVIAHLIDIGSLANLGALVLDNNQIGDEGMKAFAEAITSGSLGSLKTLWLNRNQIADEGMKAFAAASGSLHSLQKLYLQYNKIGDDGMKAFASAIASGSLANLQRLLLSDNEIGDEGMKAFASASGSLRSLQELWLQYNQIGDEGMKAFAEAIASGSLGSLESRAQTLLLGNNNASASGKEAIRNAAGKRSISCDI